MMVLAVVTAAVALLALAVARVYTHVFTTRHRTDHRSPQARRVRSVALWAVAVAAVGLVVWYVSSGDVSP